MKPKNDGNGNGQKHVLHYVIITVSTISCLFTLCFWFQVPVMYRIAISIARQNLSARECSSVAHMNAFYSLSSPPTTNPMTVMMGFGKGNEMTVPRLD